jgi:hypothetical protein
MSATVRVRNLTVHLNIENAEDRVPTLSGRAYAPSRATVHYSSSFAPSGEIKGFVRKRDGTIGVAWVTEHWRYETAPEWLKAVVDAERPEWARR